jgi:hypothetical protein
MKQGDINDLCRSVMVWVLILAGVGTLLFGCSSGGSSSSGTQNITPEVNQSPTATIALPVNTSFNEGENIVFSGTGADAEDGQLNGNALVWTSSLDGIIGNGSNLVTSALSSGDHDITLSATDTNGATYTTARVSIRVEPTRFLKMGPQTTGVVDVYYAFDGDLDTAATITTDETATIQLKAFIGGADTFHFRAKLGASKLGSIIDIEGMDIDGKWQPVDEIDLPDDKTVMVKVLDAQTYTDAEGYINLRALLINGQSPDNVPVYEFWRDDPVYSESWSTGVENADLAFDGDRSMAAVINNPSTSPESANFLEFRTYVGWKQTDTFTFNILLNSIGPPNSLVIEAQEISSGNWKNVRYLSLDTTETRTVSVQNVQSYLDEDGYISLRIYWVGLKTPGTVVEVHEIWRNDPLLVGPKTTFAGPVVNAEWAVDGDIDSFAEIHYFWNELGHQDFLHLKAYMGDTSSTTFTIVAAMSAPPDAEVIVDGEYVTDQWSIIDQFSLNGKAATTIEVPTAREFVDADGYLNLRVRWESASMNHDAYIYEIRREED